MRARRTLPRPVNAACEGEFAVDLDVWVLHVRYERTGAPDDLSALVEEYAGYALSLAHRLFRRGEPLEDLEQVALEALVRSLQRFSVERGIPFVGFATPTITGAIKRHYRDRGWTIRAPRQAHDLAGPIRSARDVLAAGLGRAPSIAEVAAQVGVSAQTVEQVDLAVRARSPSSLDTPFQPDGRTLGDTIGDADVRLERVADRAALASALEILDDRERDILVLYHFEERSQRDIAQRYGVSQMQVSRWLKLIHGRLRSRMAVAS